VRLDVPTLQEFPRHHALLEKALEHFWSDERVIGLVIGGSIAQGIMDFYSDVDLYIITRDEDFEAVFAERDVAANAIGKPLFRFIADHNPGGEHDYITLYEGPVKLDWMYCPRSDVTPGRKWAQGLVLKDQDGFLTGVKESWQEEETAGPTLEQLLVLNRKFWTWCWYVFGKIMRGESWQALSGLHAIRSMALLPMIGWAKGQSLQGYRRLEQEMSPELTSQLAATVGGLEPGELYNALEAEMDLFHALRASLFERCGLEHDISAEGVLRQEMREHFLEVHQIQ